MKIPRLNMSPRVQRQKSCTHPSKGSLFEGSLEQSNKIDEIAYAFFNQENKQEIQKILKATYTADSEFSEEQKMYNASIKFTGLKGYAGQLFNNHKQKHFILQKIRAILVHSYLKLQITKNTLEAPETNEDTPKTVQIISKKINQMFSFNPSYIDQLKTNDFFYDTRWDNEFLNNMKNTYEFDKKCVRNPFIIPWDNEYEHLINSIMNLSAIDFITLYSTPRLELEEEEEEKEDEISDNDIYSDSDSEQKSNSSTPLTRKSTISPKEQKKTSSKKEKNDQKINHLTKVPPPKTQHKAKQIYTEDPMVEANQKHTKDPRIEAKQIQAEDPRIETKQTHTKDTKIEAKQIQADDPRIETKQIQADDPRIETKQIQADDPIIEYSGNQKEKSQEIDHGTQKVFELEIPAVQFKLKPTQSKRSKSQLKVKQTTPVQRRNSESDSENEQTTPMIRQKDKFLQNSNKSNSFATTPIIRKPKNKRFNYQHYEQIDYDFLKDLLENRETLQKSKKFLRQKSLNTQRIKKLKTHLNKICKDKQNYKEKSLLLLEKLHRLGTEDVSSITKEIATLSGQLNSEESILKLKEILKYENKINQLYNDATQGKRAEINHLWDIKQSFFNVYNYNTSPGKDKTTQLVRPLKNLLDKAEDRDLKSIWICLYYITISKNGKMANTFKHILADICTSYHIQCEINKTSVNTDFLDARPSSKQEARTIHDRIQNAIIEFSQPFDFDNPNPEIQSETYPNPQLRIKPMGKRPSRTMIIPVSAYQESTFSDYLT